LFFYNSTNMLLQLDNNGDNAVGKEKTYTLYTA